MLMTLSSNFLQTQQLTPKQAQATISNAMDVGNASNFVRILEIFQHQFPALKSKLSSATVTDAETMTAVKKVFINNNYLLDPSRCSWFYCIGKISLKK